MQHEKLSAPYKSVGEAKIYDYDPDLSAHPIPPHLHAIPNQANHKVDSYLIRFERLLNWTFRGMMLLAGLGLAAGGACGVVLFALGASWAFAMADKASRWRRGR